MNLQLMGAFAFAAVLLVVIPGPNIVFVANVAISKGARAGVSAAIGIEAATLVHGLIAAAGLSAVLAANPDALTAMRFLGAAYLAWLGIQALRSQADREGQPSETAVKAGWDGFLVNLLNPKVIVFFLAFLPQFLDPNAAWPTWAQILGYVGVIVTIGVLNSAMWVFGLAKLVGTTPGRFARWATRYGTALVYFALAAVALLLRIGP